MKAFVWIIVIALVVIGGWYFVNQSETTSNDGLDESENISEQGVVAEGEERGDTMVEGDESGMMEDKMEANEVVFNITGKNFEFSVEEITVKRGDRVTINFESTSGFHDWVVDEFDAATKQVQTGGKTSVTFVADKTGEFEYYCSVGNHRAEGMVGNLIVK